MVNFALKYLNIKYENNKISKLYGKLIWEISIIAGFFPSIIKKVKRETKKSWLRIIVLHWEQKKLSGPFRSTNFFKTTNMNPTEPH